MSHQNVLKTFDDLYDGVKGDKDNFIDEDTFTKKIEELVDIGFICTGVVNDFTIYSARNELKWEDFVDIVDNIKKSILLLLVKNPRTFFVLQNTQKGKMRIISLEVKKWAQDRTKKVVTFIVVDNDKTLTEQSVDGLKRTFEEQPVKIFTLSSSCKTGFDEIKTYIDAYASDVVEDGKKPEYPMPIIALLSNVRQCEKMLKLINHINKKVIMNNSSLRYAMAWDEADKTYLQLRDKPFTIDGDIITCRTFIVEKTQALYRLGFVTATDGNLLDEDYPECANAYLYPVDISPEDQEHYRALHHPEAITHRVPFTSKDTNNSYAIQVLENNSEHFMTPITLRTGDIYYRKVITNSNAKTDDMRQFAKWCNTKGMYALVFNGYGGASVKVYRPGYPVESHKTKGKRLNELLFYITKKLNLNDKPIIIIGRRKVDRGLGFHYCPRNNDEIQIDGTLGQLITNNKEGLVWTDMILGRIEDKDSAVQKAGRLAGIIGNSPQYPGTIHYWTDEYTEQLIRRHNTIVDKSNNNTGCSVLQAVKYAENMTPKIVVNHRVSLDTFLVYTDEDIVRKVCEILNYLYRSIKPKTEGPNIGFRETSLNTGSTKVSLLDAIKKVPTAYGTNNGIMTYRVCYPCYKDINDKDSLHFVVIIRPGTDTSKIQKVKNTYPSIEIPQEGLY
jgi:hypothetical protein